MSYDDWKERIKPFEWMQHDNEFCVCLEAGDYLQNVFILGPRKDSKVMDMIGRAWQKYL